MRTVQDGEGDWLRESRTMCLVSNSHLTIAGDGPIPVRRISWAIVLSMPGWQTRLRSLSKFKNNFNLRHTHCSHARDLPVRLGKSPGRQKW
jgi:hypothetical protein